MNKVTYKNQDLTSYLLGELPEAETEVFDELSFTDDDFADELKIAEKDLIDAYVNNDLKGENLARFKTFYLASPLRREKVEFAKSFQDFAGKHIIKSNQEITVERESKSFFAGFFSIFNKPRSILQWGFALATLALMVFGGWILWENLRLRSEINQAQTNRDELLKREAELQQREKQLQDEIANQQTNKSDSDKELDKIRQEREQLAQEIKKSAEQKRLPERRESEIRRAEVEKTPKNIPRRQDTQPEREIAQANTKSGGQGTGQGTGYGSPAKIASFVLLPPLRGGNQLQTFSIPPKTSLVNIQLQLESDDFPSYRAVLQNPSDNQMLWQTRTTIKTKGKNKVLNLQIPVSLLKSQIYSLQVSGIKADGTSEIIGDYAFQSVLK